MLTDSAVFLVHTRRTIKQGALFFVLVAGNFMASQAALGGLAPVSAGEGKLPVVLDVPARPVINNSWKYVARMGVTPPLWRGKNNKKNQANCADCKDGSSSVGAEPVGRYKTNAFGFFDTVGNVREWTQDCYSATAFGDAAQYPAPYTSAQKCTRVLRGGAWDLISQGSVASIRFNASQKLRSNNIGLRVARDLKK